MRKIVLFIFALCATMMAWGETTTGSITYKIADIASNNGWNAETAYTDFDLGNEFHIKAAGSTNGVYYTSDNGIWRSYQGREKGAFTISAKAGYIITKIKVTYPATKNNGVLSKNPKPEGAASPASDQMASGTAYDFNASSVTLYVGNTDAATTNGQVSISQFEITYETQQSIEETYLDWSFGAPTTETEMVGALGIWKVYNTNAKQTLDNAKALGMYVRIDGTTTACQGYITSPVIEGGIKAVAFKWNQMYASTKTFSFSLDVDGTVVNTKSVKGTNPIGDSKAYIYSPEVKKNTIIKITNTSTYSDNSRLVVGPITIVPYIRYTQKAQTANAADETYDATTGLINNTLGGVVKYSIVTEGTQATINETTGVVDLLKVTIAEDITIKATYEDAYTTMNLHIDALPEPTVSFADGNAVTKDMNVKGYVNTLTKDGDGAVTYESSDETVATVSAEGVITIIGEGATTIKAKIAACQTYAAAEASYVLTITDPQEDAYVETFERNAGGASADDRVGAYYTWTITTGARTKATDILFNKTPSIWLSGNGGASMETTIEGGVKRVSFLWNKFNKEASPVKVSVTAGDITRELEKEVQTGDDYNQNDPDLVFNSNFGIKSNTKLKIANPQTTTALQIGPIAITPYIFYTVKDTTIDMTKVTTFTNDQLIDNRDDATAIVYSIVGENDGVATIDAETGEVTCLKTGTVTVQAAYGEAKTTYTLTINAKGNVDAKFAAEGKVEKVLADGSFTNAVVITAGDATPAYESDNTNVAEVDADGKVTIKGIGTAVITATMEETQKYLAWQDSYTLIVRTGVAADNKLVEHFTQMPKGLISTAGGEEVEGDIDVTWLAYSARRGANDTIGGAGIQGNNIFTKGYIKSQAAVEGGIKYFSLNWKQWATENNCTLKLRAELGNSEYSMEKAGTGPATYEHYFFAINAGIKSNVGVALYNESYNEEGPLASNGRITFDAFEIVPYLYYTEKTVSLMMSEESTTYQNTALIDNRDNEVAIVYSIVGENDGVATIDAATGVVTCLKAGTITIQAAWAEVTTTYTLTIQQKIDDGIVRILGIGNSFTQDALEAHIMPIILGQGKKAIVGYPYLGGCWQSRHVQNYKNDTKAYNYYKIDEEGNMTSTGANGASLKQAITDEPWDYVFIQSDHDSTGIVKSYMPYIKEIMAAVQTSCSNKDVKIGMYMTWAYDSTSTRSAFSWYNNDSQTMYDSIINATQIVMDYADVTVDMLIPAGTAIQNARTSYKGHTMNRDGYHLNYDYGRYIASLCYYSRIFGEDPKNMVYKPTTIDDYCAAMCRAAAQAAMEKPFEVTDLVDFKNPNPHPTGMNQTNGEKENKVYKVIKNNQLMIIREGRTYNIMGVEE